MNLWFFALIAHHGTGFLHARSSMQTNCKIASSVKRLFVVDDRRGVLDFAC